MKTTHTRIAAHIPNAIGELVLHAQAIVKKMTANPHVPSPTPTLAQITADIAALQDAESTVHTSKGATAPRNAKAQVVINGLHALEGCVQAAADADPAQAVEIMTSAGFAPVVHGAHPSAPLTAKMGPGGVVLLRAHAGAARSVYEWQVSSDGGKTWTSLPATNHAHTSDAALAVGTTYSFHVRANKGDVIGDWSQAVTLLVH